MTELINRVSQVAELLDARLIGDDTEFFRVRTDSRTIAIDDLFVALVGDKFDGAEYLDMAIERGAVAAIVQSQQQSDLPQIVVKDTRLALGKIAKAWRDQFTLPLVAVTGSNGKTTVKELVEFIMRNVGPGMVTTGNLNNEIGVPLTILKVSPFDTWGVVEMGASAVGDIKYLTDIVRPTIALVNNSGKAHLGGFGSAEQVASTKGEIYSGLTDDGVALINGDLEQAELWSSLAEGKKIVLYGFEQSSEKDYIVSSTTESMQNIDAPFELVTEDERVTIDLPLLGVNNRKNAVAAAAIALQLGVSMQQIKRGIENVRPIDARLDVVVDEEYVEVIDDSYNASPESVSGAIDVLSSRDGKKVLVLGDMAELGADSTALHAEIGSKASANIDKIYDIGEHAEDYLSTFSGIGEKFADIKSLCNKISQDIIEHKYNRDNGNEKIALLVKGSRSMHMERVIEHLLQKNVGGGM